MPAGKSKILSDRELGAGRELCHLKARIEREPLDLTEHPDGILPGQ